MIRDPISGMLDIYMSAMSHRLNQEMRVLIGDHHHFMPLTPISSIYGMNFTTPGTRLFGIGLLRRSE